MLENKVAIITGGTRGIGLEIARLFKENKGEVIIFGSKKESVDTVAPKYNISRSVVRSWIMKYNKGELEEYDNILITLWQVVL